MKSLLLITSVVTLVGCTSVQPPARRDDHSYYNHTYAYTDNSVHTSTSNKSETYHYYDKKKNVLEEDEDFLQFKQKEPKLNSKGSIEWNDLGF